jgi:hypothetical protein
MPEDPKGSTDQLHEADRERRYDLVATVILSVAVLLTAFSAWQSTLWNGEQSEDYALASSTRGRANAALSQGLTETSYDATTFAIGISDYYAGNLEAVNALKERVARDAFKPFLDQWIELNPTENVEAPRNPFELEEYSNPSVEESHRLSAEAEALLREGDEANQYGDNYVLTTVFFAAVLFFTGIVTKFKTDSVRVLTLVMASVALVGATAFMLTLPRIFAA